MPNTLDRYSPPFLLTLTVIGCAIPFGLVELFPGYFYWVMEIKPYLVFHNLTEFFSVMVSLSIFGIGWFSYSQSRDYHALILSAVFLVIGLVDSMHALSYAGMPDFFTPNSPDKASRFWVLVRLFSALAFFTSAFLYIKTPSRWLSKSVLLCAALALSALIFTLVVFFPDYMPAAFVPGVGQTAFKKNSEYLIIVLLLSTTVAYWYRMVKTGNRLLLYYLVAFVVSIFSELVFAFYKSAFDTYNGLGHIYKIVAFYLIYKGIFTSSIEYPYVGLAKANKLLQVEIAERQRAEDALRHLNRELQAITNCNQALMRAEEELTLLNDVCRIICDEAGYRMAWVGYAEHDEAKTLRAAAWAGVEDGYLEAAKLTWADTERGRGPGGISVRTGASACIQDFETDSRASLWRESALKRGYRSCISMPLKDRNGDTFGALLIYSEVPNIFTPDEVRLLEDLAADLAFGITVFRARVELRKAEATRTQLAAIVEYSNDAIIGKTPFGTITHWNKSAEDIYGYRAEDIIGKHISMIVPASLREEIQELMAKIRQGGVVKSHESRRIRNNGDLIDVALTLSPIKDTAGNIIGISTISRDITEHKRNTEELKRYKDRLEEEVQQRTQELVLARNAAEAANQAKSVFLASISHELRTPLNAILGFSELMRKDPQVPDNHRQNLDIINRSGEHLLTLINDVLEMAKIEAGRVQLENAPFDLGGMVRDVADMMHLRAEEKGLRLLVDQSSQFPRYISGDEARLRQVLINLVGNAIKFTQQGGVCLRLSAKKNSHTHLLIEVEDSGPGIAEQDRQRVFEPFVQIGENWDNKGTGLGLSITRQFVQLMGGSINLESELGRGSIFRIDLPLHAVSEADIAIKTQSEGADVIGLAPGQPQYRILIVEDKLENQLLMSKLMEDIGFQVQVAENGEQGVARFQSWQPHLIWMDRRMPLMDGLEATRRIRRLPGGKDVKIIAVTASAFIEQRSESYDAGMDDFIRKPYRFSEVYACMAKHLGVRYRYADKTETDSEATGSGPGLPEMLAGLPEKLRSDLKDALESLETATIDDVIEQIAEHDRKLQKTLSQLAESLDYTAILKALETFDRCPEASPTDRANLNAANPAA